MTTPKPNSASASPALTPRQKGSIAALVAIGILCCLVQYAARISFWHDEAYQVQNVIEQSYAQLVSTMGRFQTAPPLFITAVKFCGQQMGYSEYALRLVPLLAGIGAILAFAALAIKMLPSRTACLAVALMALSPKLIEHATEVKQYSGDVLASTLMLLAAAAIFGWTFRDSTPSSVPVPLKQNTLRLFLLALLAGMLFWYSEVQLFIFAGMALALLPRFAAQRFRGGLAFAVGCAPAVVSFAAIYLLSMQYQRNSALISFWVDEGGLPDYSRWWMLPLWPLHNLFRLCNYYCNPLGPISVILAAAGVWFLWSRRHSQREVVLALLLPIGITLIAAMALRYPFGGSRATMFLVPIVVLLTSVGFAQLLDRLPRFRNAIIIGAFILAGSGAVQAAYHLAVPRNVSHPRPAIEYVQAHRTPDQAIWISHGSTWEEFRCYWRDLDPLIWSPVQTPEFGRVKQFWIIVEFAPTQGIKKRAAERAAAQKLGRPIDQFIGNGGAAFLYQLNTPATTRPPER